MALQQAARICRTCDPLEGGDFPVKERFHRFHPITDKTKGKRKVKALLKSNIFYGWFIVGAAFFIMALGWGSVYNASSIFIQPITKELGFTRSEFNVTLTIKAVCLLVVSLLAGKIYSRFNIMKVMKVFSVTLVLSFYLYSFASTLLMFYAITIVVSTSLSLIAILPLSIILSNWFVKGRGSAIGMAFMGSGVGGMILSSLTGIWIQNYGWRVAYQFLTVLMAVFILPGVFLIIRTQPSHMGLKPYGITEESAETYRTAENEGIMLKEAFRSVIFWAVNLATVCLNIAINGLMLNVAPHLTDIGYSITFSANVVALIMGSLAIGKAAFGKLYDTIGLKATILIACIANIIALTGVIFSRSYIGLAVTVIFVGVGCAYGTIASSVLANDLFGKKDFNAIYGFLTAIGGVGSILNPIIYGFLYDSSGSYISSYLLSIVLCVVALFIFLAIFSWKKPVPALN